MCWLCGTLLCFPSSQPTSCAPARADYTSPCSGPQRAYGAPSKSLSCCCARPGENQWFPSCLSCELYVLLLFILFSRCGTLPSLLEKKSLDLQEPYQMPPLRNLLRSALHPVFSLQAELITLFPLLSFAFDGCASVCLSGP